MTTPDISVDLIYTVLEKHNPRWMFDWADQRDLVEALDKKCRNPEFDVSEFLTNRQRQKVHAIMHATYCAMNQG